MFLAAMSLLGISEAFWKAATYLNGSGHGLSFVYTYIRRWLVLNSCPRVMHPECF
jgi:hypothetical protein